MPFHHPNCPSCGAPVAVGARFCERCGAPVGPANEGAVPKSRAPQIQFRTSSDGRFGVLDRSGTKLTFSDSGTTNNTQVHVDGGCVPFSAAHQRVLAHFQTEAIWHECSNNYDGVDVVQRLRIVEGVHTGELDTLQIQYWLTNRSRQRRQVGVRIMIDTYIGNNDGVPFIVPGRDGLVDRQMIVERDRMPEFIQALERSDFTNPGLMVNLSLRGNDAVRPDRLVLSHWPGSSAGWDYSVTDIGRDSAVGLYYNPRVLQPGERRPVIAFYGLGGLSSLSSGNTRLALIAPRVLPAGKEGTVVVLVREPQGNQQVTLTVEPPLSLAYGQTATKPVRSSGPAGYCELAWRIQPLDAHREAAQVEARLDPGNVIERATIAIIRKR